MEQDLSLYWNQPTRKMILTADSTGHYLKNDQTTPLGLMS